MEGVDFMDSWFFFGFAPKNEKSVFGFGNPDLDFPKRRTLFLYTWNVLLENFEVIYHYCYIESLGSENMKDLVNFEWN